MSLPAGTLLGPYEVLGPLGAGGMGEVYRARDVRLARLVAVKILPEAFSQDPRRVARFETEARMLAALSHPNILAIHDFGRSDGRLYAVTELLDGETLRERMSGGPLTWRKAAALAASIADGLGSAHAAGIVHRDLKPENVFLTSDARVKVLDFGLAQASGPVSQEAVTASSPPLGALSADGEVAGTLSYMAPEQLRGLRADGRADTFALGCVLYEMLSGKTPFAGATPADTLSAILREEPRPLEPGAGVPAALVDVVFRCLEKRPEDRYDTSHDLAIALRSIASHEHPAVAPARGGARRPLGKARPLALALGAAAVAAGLLLVATRSWAPSKGPEGTQRHDPPRQITSAPGWDAEPALSPDGTLIAYSSNAAGTTDIWLVEVHGGEPLRLTNGPGEASRPAWFPDGRSVAFVLSAGGAKSVWKVPRLGGSPMPLIENADMPAISADGKRIAFARAGSAPGGPLRIWTAPLDRPAEARRLTGDGGGLWGHIDPAWSPDGSRICYADIKNLWLADVDTGRARPLTTDDGVDWEPVWSASGDSLYFSSLRGGTAAIWRISASGGEPVQETSGSGPERHPSVSPDGRHLVYSTAFSNRGLDILVIDREAGTTFRFGSALADAMPAYAPDGRSVVYVSDRMGKFDLWSQSMTGGKPAHVPPRRLTDLETGPATPVVTPDGQWVAYFRALKGRRDIWMLPMAGGAPVRVTDRPVTNIHPAFSPDGSRLAFVSDRSGRDHVWIQPMRGAAASGEAWQLTEGEEADTLPSFSPDGTHVAFLRAGEIWVATAERGAASRRVTHDAEAHCSRWEPAGRSLLASGMWGGSGLRIRKVHADTGATEPLTPDVVLGNRDTPGYFGLTRDGRYLAVDVAETKGNLWIVETTDGVPRSGSTSAAR